MVCQCWYGIGASECVFVLCDVQQCFPFSKACALSLSLPPVSLLTAAGEVVLHQDGGGAVEFGGEHLHVGHPRRQWQWAGPLPVLRHHGLGPGEWTFWRGATHADHESVNICFFFCFFLFLFFKTGREEMCTGERRKKGKKTWIQTEKKNHFSLSPEPSPYGNRLSSCPMPILGKSKRWISWPIYCFYFLIFLFWHGRARYWHCRPVGKGAVALKKKKRNVRLNKDW